MQNVASHLNLEKALSIGGWMNPKELEWLATQASTHLYIVEFGCFHGRSTRVLADNIKTGGKVWAVDPWGGDYFYEDGKTVPFSTYIYPYFVRNLQDHIERGSVYPIRNFSENFNLAHKVDMVFIDGDHRYETVVKDIKKAMSLLKDGGLICGHDYDHPDWPGVKKAVDEYIHNAKIAEGTMIWNARKF